MRPVPERDGAAVLAIDLGASRSWSAATLAGATVGVRSTPSGPGVPSLAEQEKRDGLPPPSPTAAGDAGSMAVAHGRQVADIDVLLDLLPDVDISGVVADRFAMGTLADALTMRGSPDPEWRVISGVARLRISRRFGRAS